MEVAELKELEMKVHQLLQALDRLHFENSSLKRKFTAIQEESALLKRKHSLAREKIRHSRPYRAKTH